MNVRVCIFSGRELLMWVVAWGPTGAHEFIWDPRGSQEHSLGNLAMLKKVVDNFQNMNAGAISNQCIVHHRTYLFIYIYIYIYIIFIHMHVCWYAPGYVCTRVHPNFFLGDDIVMWAVAWGPMGAHAFTWNHKGCPEHPSANPASLRKYIICVFSRTHVGSISKNVYYETVYKWIG